MKNKQEMFSTLLAEYNALRAEILKRMEFQHQFVSLALVIVGTLLSIGLQPGFPVSPLFVYPLVALFLALGWKHHNTRIKEIGSYISNHIESKTEHIKWETYYRRRVDSRQPKLVKQSWRFFSASGVFIGTQVITIILVSIKSSFSPAEQVLISSNLLALAITIRILGR